ncbi:hypothetical protein, conserved [Eimeria maxima]|uniref:EF-hand domain-containing protein n=1 Tax=Eimeria maxima TaxID=5804 RepID=U6M064_EIMMA|nr:hypothetical protein, conserved [Eimeria maxima]CDJ57592.1 hypothetical protein, conserved [Eimeria maxima]
MGWSWGIAVALACVQIALGLGVRAKVEDPQPDDLLLQDQTTVKRETHEEFVENWVLIVLFIVIIILSILFETLVGSLQDYLRRRGFHKLQEMLNCAFKELTILGFISLFLYATIRLGAVRKVNDKYLGVSKTEEAAIAEAEAKGEEPYPPTHLTETFETIHVLIFLIMVTFICQVAALTAVGYRTMRSLAYLDSKTDEDLKNDVAALHEGRTQNSNEKMTRKALEHWGIRQRFVLAANPLMPKPRKQEPGSPRFSFAAYLIHCFGDSLATMIELPPSILVLTLLIVVLLRPALSLPGREVIIFMIIAAFGLLFSTYLAYRFLKYADAKIRPDAGALLTLFGAPLTPPDDEVVQALHCPIDDGCLIFSVCRWLTGQQLCFPSAVILQRDVQILDFLMHQVKHQKATLGRLFDWLDTDGDRQISLEELEGALSGMKPPISREEILSLMQRISIDGRSITEQTLFAWARRTRARSLALVTPNE